ncbi:hypothetical protein dsat_1772 [Alkalidesulfovibrio alkalitolerans DSM 16529]|uniref:Uncharacterized protein n=1 Tax=Alkalidesulfovibrio alkalitolerans DSM 16529 TaxID=1121439 RepID=S7UQE0_9BACT|nr:hypothetical protein [Alkalidesulfovibrio alkalitolerans]EPR36244.1 hypothetical protein dsat_1772 [Alkalidesulfovibrio alkalitolerans DSM 16529]
MGSLFSPPRAPSAPPPPPPAPAPVMPEELDAAETRAMKEAREKQKKAALLAAGRSGTVLAERGTPAPTAQKTLLGQ